MPRKSKLEELIESLRKVDSVMDLAKPEFLNRLQNGLIDIEYRIQKLEQEKDK